MSIDSEQPVQASITEGDRALQLFIDRYQFTRLLLKRINDDSLIGKSRILLCQQVDSYVYSFLSGQLKIMDTAIT